jgi:branched-chain amino acid transport system substrate-binding protein
LVFADSFDNGGTVMGRQTITPGAKSFSSAVRAVQTSGADFVYFRGEYSDAGPLRAEMSRDGLHIPLIGGDGVYNSSYIRLAGPGSEGDYATSIGVPLD